MLWSGYSNNWQAAEMAIIYYVQKCSQYNYALQYF